MSGPFTLDMICGPASTPTITEQPFVFDQSFEIDISATPFFTFSSYLNSAGCVNAFNFYFMDGSVNDVFVTPAIFDSLTALWKVEVVPAH